MEKGFRFGRISEMRGVLFGMAILGIMIFHSPLELALYEVRFFKVYGNTGVELFLILSAVGLYASLEKDARLGAFYWKRILRTVLPAVPVMVVWFGYFDLLGGAGWRAFFADVTLLNFWRKGFRSEWFIALILVLYAVYPALHRLRRSRHGAAWMWGLIAAFTVLNIVWNVLEPVSYERTEIAFSRVPSFLLGLLIAPAVLEDKKAPRGMLWMCAAAFCALFAFKFFRYLDKPWSRLINAPLTILATILLAELTWRCAPRRGWQLPVHFFAFLGGFTLELYLLHERVLRVVGMLGVPKGPYGLVRSVVAIVMAIPVAWLYAKACGWVRAKLPQAGK